MNKHITGHFNHDLYRKIRQAREEAGLEVACLTNKIEDHELIGKEFIDKKTNKRYTVESVHNHWYNGWYEVLIMVDSNHSSRVVFWRNIDCRDEIILSSIDKNREVLYFLNEDGRYVKTYK